MALLYMILLGIHNLNRWLVLLSGLWALLQNIPGLGGQRPFTPAERRPVSIFMGTLHLQVVLGLIMFAVMGMLNSPAFASSRPSFQWEHFGLGVLAAVFATIGNRQARSAPTDQAKYRAAALWCGLALLSILLAMPWARSWIPFVR